MGREGEWLIRGWRLIREKHRLVLSNLDAKATCPQIDSPAGIT